MDLPVYYMPMPINADGNGPADASDTVRVLHQVWDANYTVACEAPTEESARSLAAYINANTVTI
jgi:hypothetical protein